MAEFEWLNKKGVRSDRGFIVQFTGRYTMEYREGEHSMQFCVDFGIDPVTRKGLQLVQVHPFPAWGGPPIEHRRREILGNIRRAIEFQRLTPVFLKNSGETVSEEDEDESGKGGIT